MAQRLLLSFIFLVHVSFFRESWAWTVSSHPTPFGEIGLDSNKEAQTSLSTLQSKDRIQLLSLQWTQGSNFSKPVQDVWRWKDSVLGDGRDYFVPKPRTLQALQDYIQSQCPTVTECIVISNCARFEILVVAPDNSYTQISQCVEAQVRSHEKKKMHSSFQKWLPPQLDWPGVIDASAGLSAAEISKEWAHHQGVEEVTSHLCHIAAGVATRPRRPDRPVAFRPFSSRDAHIMLQLKRTRQIASDYPKLRILLDYALRAGKAARDVHKVPELQKLRQYGTGDSKYSMEPPMALVDTVKEAALLKAVEPMVKECTKKFQTDTNVIQRIRSRAESLAENPKELKLVKQRLHLPMVEMRQGRAVDEHEFLQKLEEELLKLRGSTS